ncbi:MAG: chemotaxis protein CheA [Caldicoprobacterales bacterium]|jgi:two-component system chemotaxis sensor kinase CheA|nr:chemotaxis protein CheA [Clostridiales bacterium]
MDSNTYITLFIEEAKEHIQILNDNLLKLETANENNEPLNEVFRAAHTLKGMAGTLGFEKITNIAHAMENVLDDIRNHKMEITGPTIDILLECTDAMEALVQDILELGGEGPRDIKKLLSKLNQSGDSFTNNASSRLDPGVLKLDEYQSNIINAGIHQGLIPYWVEITLRPTCLLKAARAYIVFQTLEKFGEIIKTLPQVQDIEEERFEDTFGMLLLTQEEETAIRRRLDLISELQSIKIDKLPYGLEGEGNAGSTDLSEATDSIRESTTVKQRIPQDRTRIQTRSIRVDTEKLDNLMNLVSELITIKNTLVDITEESTDPSIKESMEYLARITNGLHDAVTKVRMVPIEMVFSRFPRVVRDLSKNTKKEIVLDIVGAETEIDRTIIDEIGDPLIHLLRNAVDHGIETPDQRIKVGKDPVGRIELKAHHDGNNVVIIVEDDGHGINLKKIVNKALQKGLISDESVDNLEVQDIINLMFHPGFSTAGSISNISGRGVGMDVVKTKVESMGGTIDVTTQEGMGSRFTIRLPLTLSIIQALLVEVVGEIYAIPLNSIQEILDISVFMIKKFESQETIQYNGRLLPLVRLDEVLDANTTRKQQAQNMKVVVVKKGDRQFALSIGNLIGQQDIVIKTLGKYLSSIKMISGATILGDGRVALILDINHLI